jgi:hypothetical protein
MAQCCEDCCKKLGVRSNANKSEGGHARLLEWCVRCETRPVEDTPFMPRCGRPLKRKWSTARPGPGSGVISLRTGKTYDYGTEETKQEEPSSSAAPLQIDQLSASDLVDAWIWTQRAELDID